jgi:hypothetical protein
MASLLPSIKLTLALLVSILPGFAAAATLALAYAPPFTMSAIDDQAEISLPVTLNSGTAAAQVCVEKIGVQFPTGTDDRIVELFSVQSSLVTDKVSLPTLKITVKQVSHLLPGVYQLNLRLFECQSGQRGKDLETFVVPITRPSIKLEPLSKVVIDRWVYSPWSDDAYRISPAHLTFRPQEDTKNSPIQALKVEPSNFTTGAISTNVGSWTAPAPANVAAGDAFDIALKPSAFPVGVASGQITLRSNDLQTPLRFDVEVRTRLAAWWIVVVVILGVIAGWLLRIVLQRKIDLAIARRTALDNLQRYQTELASVPDGEFVNAVQPPVNELLAAVNADDPDAINTAVPLVSAKVESARAQLNSKLVSATTAIDTFRNTFDVSAQLPAKFAAVRDDAIRSAIRYAAMLSPPNPTAALGELDEKQRRVIEGLGDAVTSLKDELGLVLDKLSTLSPFLAEAERQRLVEKISALQTSVATIVPAVDLAGAKTLMLETAQLGRNLHALLEWAARALEFDAPVLDHLIASRTYRTDPALDAARADLKDQIIALALQVRAQTQLEDMFVSPPWSAAADAALAKGRSLMGLLGTNRSDLAENAKAAFRQKVADGNWHAALLELLEANPLLGAAEDLRRTKDIPVLGDLNAGIANIAPSKVALQAPQVGAFTQPAIAAAKLRNKSQLARAEGMQSLVVGFLLASTSFAFFEEKFIGTWGELLALFFWGFSADLSVDKLAEKVRGLGIAPK